MILVVVDIADGYIAENIVLRERLHSQGDEQGSTHGLDVSDDVAHVHAVVLCERRMPIEAIDALESFLN